MRYVSVPVIVLSIVSVHIINAQTVPDSVYYERLFYTGKVWGFVKYFHTEVAKGTENWDSDLIITLPSVRNATSKQEFNSALVRMLDRAGEMAQPAVSTPELPDSLRFNLDLGWIQDTIFTAEVRAILDTIQTRFRPQKNYYVGEVWAGGNATFDNDAQYHTWGDPDAPTKSKRILALFRYWNIINYFYPYNNVIDQDWDTTLIEFIPKIVNAEDEVEYHLAFLELATRIDDTHAFTYSSVINTTIFGDYYLPLTLKYIDNQTVIARILISNDNIKTGDVIQSINDMTIHAYRDSLRRYTAGSNTAAIERNINSWILRGPNTEVQLLLENDEGVKDISITRSVSAAYYFELIEPEGPIWEIVYVDDARCGYVDMERLEVSHISSMFTDLWETDGICFDVRNYPQGTMWDMIRYLFDDPIHIADFTVPDITYPGTVSWFSEYVGSGNFSKTYDKKICILFNEDTQSQAEYTVMAFEQHPKAVKIGSQTAGADGNVSHIYLPGGIITYFTGLGVFYPDGTETQRIGIVPDIEIHPTIQGIREGRDEVLEAALRLFGETDIEGDISTDDLRVPQMFTLFQNYPNPFNPITSIEYALPDAARVQIHVYNTLGQVVAVLVDSNHGAGLYTVQWDASDAASGLYFYRFKADNFSLTKKMLLLK